VVRNRGQNTGVRIQEFESLSSTLWRGKLGKTLFYRSPLPLSSKSGTSACAALNAVVPCPKRSDAQPAFGCSNESTRQAAAA
jgi:hypothetical protein